MLTFDTVVLILVFLGALIGFIRGFVRQVLGLIGVLLGVYLAYKFSGAIAIWWSKQFEVSMNKTQVLVFICLVLASSISAMLLAKAMEKFLKLVLLAWLNRLSGMIFGAVQVVLILAAILYAYNALELKTGASIEQWLTDSASYSLLLDLANLTYPYLQFG